MRQGKNSFTREFSHKSFHGTLCLLLIYEYKSHKETCIHTRGHAKEENLEKVE